MQEKLHNISNIKERIIYFVENQRLKKVDFFTNIGMSGANFRGNQLSSALNSNTIERIITLFPELNLFWLITGKGRMLNETQENIVNEPSPDLTNPYLKTIEILEERIADLKSDKEMLKSLLLSKKEKNDL